MKFFSIVLLILFPYLSHSQSFSTYDRALEAFKEYAKNSGFRACEAKYEACKHLRSSSIRNIDEIPNQSTGRIDVDIIYDYHYVGCYIGWDQYNGSAKVKGYIVQTSDGQFKYGERGVEVLQWDRDK
jgi:hypothetical protein